jgi:hypothetical protein
MKSYAYGGIGPEVFFWGLIACTVIMFLLFIYEETLSKKYWGKAGTIRVSVIVALWLTALTLQIHADYEKKDGLKEANQKVIELIESKGLKITGGAVNVSADNHSSVAVKLPEVKDAKDATKIQTSSNCEIFAPKDTNQDVGIICGATENGMSLDNLIKWNADGQPEDTKKYQNNADDTKKIVESITASDQSKKAQQK